MIVSLIFNVMFGTITAFIIERFQIIQGLHLYNTIGAPIVIYVASDLMQLYIYRQFISGISVALDEAALLDGCSYFGLFVKIIFPLLAPATATVCIIKAINIINDMYIPYLYMPKKQTAYADNVSDELRQCPAGFLTDSGGRHHYHYDPHHRPLCLFPEVHSGRGGSRSSKGIIQKKRLHFQA